MDATIAAISTAMSASGIGIVRISGEKAMDVIANIYRSKNGKKDIREVEAIRYIMALSMTGKKL